MLEVKNLRVHYGKVEAVKGISLHLEDKDFICLIGANGAGKSTTIKTISALKNATSGEIWFQGHRIDHLSPERIANTGVIQVPEGRRIFPYLTVFENLMVGAYVTKDRKKIEKRLDSVFQRFPKLAMRKNQQGGSMSGGEQQMLAFGRALMAEPKLLMLDEPTLGLAPVVVQEVAKFIRTINRDEGIGMILVEQNAKLALSLSNRGYVMELGTIAVQGQTSELLNSEHVKKAYLGM
jgi:branched-chain amino acid transport system ATP-binding protein